MKAICVKFVDDDSLSPYASLGLKKKQKGVVFNFFFFKFYLKYIDIYYNNIIHKNI